MKAYKATRPDGTDFYSGSVLYQVGKIVDIGCSARRSPPVLCSSSVLHASDAKAETLIGGQWPCRLFAVEGRSVVGPEYHKYGFRRLRVVEELPAWQALGPNGQEAAALIERCRTLTEQEGRDLRTALDAARDAWAAARAAAWDAAWDATWAAALDAARDATRDAARDAARAAAWAASWDASWAAALDATRAIMVRDLISAEHFDMLYGPWRSVMEDEHG